VNCSPNELRWWRFSIAILLRTQWDYQRWDSQNESTWRASEYDQYLHQHQQLSMKTTNEAYRALHIKVWERHYTSEEVTLWTLTQLRSTVSSNHKWSKNSAWASSISLNLDEQRLTNVITVKTQTPRPARNLNKREEVAATNTCIVHNALSWTVCYNNMCWTHMSSKDKAEWYSQKLKKQNSYNTTGWLKRLF
jgi:hypothetical protein